MKKLILIFTLIFSLAFSLISCASKPRDWSVITPDEWNSVKESRIVSLENITLDGESFWKDIILDDNKKPLKNCDCTIYVLFEERLASEEDDWLYVKGLPYDTPFIFRIDDGK